MKFPDWDVEIIRFILPTPQQSPGYEIHMFWHSTPRRDFKAEFVTESGKPEPARGQAWDNVARNNYALWKLEFFNWLRQHPDIQPLCYVTI